jgi:hypothetical protein
VKTKLSIERNSNGVGTPDARYKRGRPPHYCSMLKVQQILDLG